jgi:hypothetical protein
MRKLKLNADTLQVESFEVYAGGTRRAGTVRANVITPDCSAADDCAPTYFEATCNCANTSPLPSCMDCSWDDACVSVPPQCD